MLQHIRTQRWPRFFFLALLGACDEPPEPPFIPTDVEAQYLYYPLEVGKFTEYRVDSIVYDFGTNGGTLRDTTSRLVREEITDTVRDNTGALVFLVERSERPNDTQPWAVMQIWSASRTPTQALRTENNLRFLRLVFPFDTRTRWNGNLWIDQYQEIEIAGERIRPFINWDYHVDDFGVSAQVGAFAFDSLLVVTEVDETNAIERRLSRAWYARNIGLVKREQWILDSQYCNQVPAPADCLTKPWEEKAQKGFIMNLVLLAHN
ncbi:MAG: hypothetical protein ACKVU2_00165 [Saprospiraceae bacterium]